MAVGSKWTAACLPPVHRDSCVQPSRCGVGAIFHRVRAIAEGVEDQRRLGNSQSFQPLEDSHVQQLGLDASSTGLGVGNAPL